MPVPGIPTVVLIPLLPIVLVNPRPPKDRLAPERDRLIRTPGRTLMRRENLQPIRDPQLSCRLRLLLAVRLDEEGGQDNRPQVPRTIEEGLRDG